MIVAIPSKLLTARDSTIVWMLEVLLNYHSIKLIHIYIVGGSHDLKFQNETPCDLYA